MRRWVRFLALLAVFGCADGLDEEGGTAEQAEPPLAVISADSPSAPDPVEPPQRGSGLSPVLLERLRNQQPQLLSPSAFDSLPDPTREDLALRGCEIPQTFVQEAPHNVTRGAFADADTEDWAVLCSIAGRSSILVYWEHEPGPCPVELAASDNVSWNQGIGGERAGFSRYVVRYAPDWILSRQEWWESYDLPADLVVDHDGVADAFAGKGSDVWYCWRGRWLKLPGAD